MSASDQNPDGVLEAAAQELFDRNVVAADACFDVWPDGRPTTWQAADEKTRAYWRSAAERAAEDDKRPEFQPF